MQTLTKCVWYLTNILISFLISNQTYTKHTTHKHNQSGNYFFMDSETFEEIMVNSQTVEDQKKWIVEGMECQLIVFKGEVIEVNPPSPYVYEIVETEPNVKGNSAQGVTKPAVLDCGATITVPGFVEQGSKVKVDTSNGEYMERV